jgi:hypothetical protein
MKIITYSRIGYNAPSGANWAYQIYKVDFIDVSKGYGYCALKTVKTNFGGEIRWCNAVNNERVIEIKGVYTKTGTPKITGISTMEDMESKDFINECINFLN